MPAGPADDGWSIPQLATHLHTTQAIVRGAVAEQHLQPLLRRQRLARQRQRAAQQRATDRAIALGFQGRRAYLEDRLVTKVWTLRQIEVELGVAPATLRHLLDQVCRVAPTQRQHAAAKAAIGPPSKQRRSTGAARHAWPNSASQRWRSTYRTGFSPEAGRGGGCAPNSA